jgi:hypothetical protein
MKLPTQYFARSFAALVTTLAFGTSQAQSVDVFGLPLGEKFPPSTKRCQSAAGKQLPPCWFDDVVVTSDGWSRGNVAIVDGDSPAWTAQGRRYVLVDPAGRLMEFKVTGVASSYHARIERSIARLFGERLHPNVAELGTPVRWQASNARAEMLCGEPGGCTAAFRATAYDEQTRRRIEDSVTKASTRPRTK